MAKTIRILTTLFNAEKYIARCIKSMQFQTYTDFVCYITDDCSTDKSVEVAKMTIGDDKRFEIIQNTEKMYQTGNYYTVMQRDEIQDDEICITIDGDDRLSHTKALERIIREYEDPDTWMTYGSFLYYKGQAQQYEKGFAAPPRSGIDSQRNDNAYTTTHMRTWMSWLFRKIAKEDFMMEGSWIPMAGDLCFMFPMLEMATKNHSRFIPDYLYIYNIETSGNEFKTNGQLVEKCAAFTRNKPPYKELKI